MGFGVVGGVLAVGGLALVLVGALAWSRRLPRNRFAGVRTVNTLRDAETFAVGNRVAGPAVVASGAIAAVAGLALLAAPPAFGTPVRVTVLAVGVLGVLGLNVAGGVLGDRAARRVPARRFGGCGGSCGCCERATDCAVPRAGNSTDGPADRPHRDADDDPNT